MGALHCTEYDTRMFCYIWIWILMDTRFDGASLHYITHIWRYFSSAFAFIHLPLLAMVPCKACMMLVTASMSQYLLLTMWIYQHTSRMLLLTYMFIAEGRSTTLNSVLCIQSSLLILCCDLSQSHSINKYRRSIWPSRYGRTPRKGRFELSEPGGRLDHLMKISGHSTGHELCHQVWLTLSVPLMLPYILIFR